MRTFYVSGILIAFAIFSSPSYQFQVPIPQETQTDPDVRFTATKTGRKLHDDFYTLIEAAGPVEDTLNKALTWDVEAQYEHFQLLEDHIKADDKYAKYCAQVVKAAQDLLDVTLKKIGIKHEVDIRDYIKGLYDFEAARPISPVMKEVVSGINDYRNNVVKKLEEEQDRSRVQAADPTETEISAPTEAESITPTETETAAQGQAESQEGNKPTVEGQKQADEDSDDDSDDEAATISTESQSI